MDKQVLYAFLLTTIAGLSTMIGCIFILFPKKTKKVIVGSLSFASAVMLTVSFTDLIPESFGLIGKEENTFPTILWSLIFIVIGIIVSMLIDKYLPENKKEEGCHKSLYRVGFISMLAIILHNIPEGIATFMAGSNNQHLGIALATAIALHNIPEGIGISIPIYYATGSKKRAILYTFISGLSEPFGALLAFLFLGPFVNDFIMGSLFSFIAGIMIHISCYELIPASKKYNDWKITTIFFFIGILFMLVNHLIFG